MDSDSIEQTAALWLTRRRREDWSATDQVELDTWLDAATAHQVAYLRLEAGWDRSGRLTALAAGIPKGTIPERGTFRFSPLFSRRLEVPPEESEARPRYRWATAATVLLAMGAATYLSLELWTGDSYTTPIGGRNTVALTDGSEVTLNTDTRVRVSLTDRERNVNLEQGEAFFDVAKDPARPFVVTVGDQRVIAVGTQFSVRLDDDTEEIRVAVAEGRVRLEQGKPSAVPTEIGAGTLARTSERSVMVKERAAAEVEQALTWRSGYVNFRDTELREAVAEFNRYTPRKIIIADDSIAQIRVGGNFRSDNIEAFLSLLQSGFPIVATEGDDEIILTAR